MEKNVLKWMTTILGALTIIVCLVLGIAPAIKESMQTSSNKKPPQTQQSENAGNAQNTEVDSQKGTESESESEQKPEIQVAGDIDITLPAGIAEGDVEIENDYGNKKIYVRFAKVDEGYSKSQAQKGDSKYISTFSYEKEDEKGVLTISLNTVCEHFYSFKDGHLLIDFKDVHDVYDKIVVIDAGHGGSEPGAIRKDIKEKRLNLEIVLQIKALFDEVDESKVKVFYTRTEDKHVPLKERSLLANALKADLFISIHNNSQGEEEFSEYNGTMVLFSEGGLKESKTLARKCLTHVLKNTGSKDQGLVQGDYVYIVRSSEVPVALIEVGFMTNEAELDRLSSVSYQKKVAKGVFDAIMEALEEGL